MKVSSADKVRELFKQQQASNPCIKLIFPKVSAVVISGSLQFPIPRTLLLGSKK